MRAWVLSCLVWLGDLQFRGPCSLFPLPPVPVTKVCCHSVCVRSKANIRDSVTPYFSSFYFRTSAGTGGLCKAKAGRGGEEKERGLWPMGWTVVLYPVPLWEMGLFYFILL